MTDHSTPPQRGDEAELFQRYQARLRRSTRLAINTTPEIVDDACAYAWMRFIVCQPRRETAFGWLCTVARNEALALHRRAVERSVNERPMDGGDGGPRLASRSNVEVLDEFKEVRRRLAELPPRQREVVLLHAAGWRYRELAERFGISESRIGHLVVRATERMREMDAREEDVRSPRGRRLHEIENKPPRYIVAAIGRPPSPRAKDGQRLARLNWKRLVLQIEDYRTANGITDEVLALGRGQRVPPADLIAERIVSYRRERGLSLGIDL
jgi:RNA polymerase sigma factor (sigma-70 family)